MQISEEVFGTTREGAVGLWTLISENMRLELINYGATIRSLHWNGQEICLGLEDIAAYEGQRAYMGATCGRYANRIAHARFSLNDRTHVLFPNDPPHTLHGGMTGFSRRVWNAETYTEHSQAGLILHRISHDGEDGFPGKLSVRVEYHLTSDDYLIIYYRAESDAPCPVNLTNHAYWNLEAGGGTSNHEVMIPADLYVEVDNASIPTGRLLPVDGDMDLRHSVQLAMRMGEGRALSKGFDHCYVLNTDSECLYVGDWNSDIIEKCRKLDPRLAARVQVSKRIMEVYTSYPGIQFYTGCHLNEWGRGGRHYKPYSAFCLESQFFPDSPNHPQFPDTVLRPGELYEQIIIHKFLMI